MTQSLICAIAHIVGTWLAAAGKVNSRYFLSDAETYVSLRIMYIEFIPVATAYFMPPAVYCRFRTGLLALQVALEMVFAFLLGYHPRAGLSEGASGAWTIFIRVFICSQTSMILHISIARPLLGRLRHALWGLRFLVFAQSNVDYCSVQQHDGVASRALGRAHAAIFDAVGLGLVPAAPVAPALACAITANFVLAAVAVAIPEIYWHIHEARLRRRLRGAEPETAFSQLACWEGLALLTPCLAALCWLVAQVTTAMEASRLGWTLARLNVALTGAPMPAVFVR